MIKEFNLKDLFPDCETIPPACDSSVVYILRYGKNGEGLELGLFHSENEGDAEYQLNIVEIDGQNEFIDQTSFDATALAKPNITQFSVDVIDKDVSIEKIKRILSENGIEVCGISNDNSWKYDEYIK